MDYIYDRDASNICVNMNPKAYSEKKKLSEILMPETLDSNGVKFSTAGLISLSEFISYTSEKDMLYFVYSLLKAMSEWNDKSDPSLMLITDIETIFYDPKKHRFCFAAKESNGVSINLVGLITNLLFEAVYKEKELQVAAELISFIRASIHTSPRDVLLFLEMSKYGRSFVADWSKVKKTFEAVTGHTDSLAESHKNKMLSKVNNSMDFSDFLSVDDLFSDAVSEEKAPEPVQEAPVQQEVFYSQPEPQVYMPEPEPVIAPEPVQQAPVQQDVFYNRPEPQIYMPEPEPVIAPEPVQEQMSVPQVNIEPKNDFSAVDYSDDEADIPYSEAEFDDADEDVPYVEEAFSAVEPVDEPLEDFMNEEIPEDVPYTQEDEHDVSYKEEETEDSYPVSAEEYDGCSSDDYESEDQTVILTEDDYCEEIVSAFLVDANGTSYCVDKNYFVIGRNSKESDLSVRDSSMSRKHAAIIKIGEEFYIEDLNSMNKTFLNGEQVMPNSRKLLSDGSEVLVSRNKFIFRITVDVERR